MARVTFSSGLSGVIDVFLDKISIGRIFVEKFDNGWRYSVEIPQTERREFGSARDAKAYARESLKDKVAFKR